MLSDAVAERVVQVRKAAGVSQEELAERCRQLGEKVTAATLANIETGRRDRTGRRRRHVTVDELLVLASALGVAPVDLLVPSTVADDEPYNVAPKVTTTAGTARQWIGGRGFLKDLESPADLAEAIRWMPKARAQTIAREWFQTHETELIRRANVALVEEQQEADDE